MKREQLSDSDRARMYEAEKAEWVRTHPDATPAEYTAAMREIADRIGF